MLFEKPRGSLGVSRVHVSRVHVSRILYGNFACMTMGTRVEDDDKSNGAMKLLLAVIIVAALLSRRWVARSLLPAVKREQRTNNEAGAELAAVN